jgi:Na+-translocating ferredoxin:NAD+ oxidoreductase RnfD subunit
MARLGWRKSYKSHSPSCCLTPPNSLLRVIFQDLLRGDSVASRLQEIMTASLLNQTLFITSSPVPPSNSQPPEWDAVAVYGLVFGLLAVLLAFPGTYPAVVALRRHREHEVRESKLGFCHFK